MSRAIKFRQRNKNNGQWHYWGCIRDGEFTGPMTSDNYVRPEESNEFIGLYDKNGKEIYEGDIVKIDFPRSYHNENLIKTVEWINNGFKYCDSNDQGDYAYENCEVIGNKWYNPDLMK